MGRIALMLILGFAMITAVMPAVSQTPAQKPQFEVASVKSSKPGRVIKQASDVTVSFSADRFTAENVTLLDLIDIAYHVQPWQVSGGPNWIDPGPTTTGRYDVLAKAEHEASPDDLRLMLRSLLTERFMLVLRHEFKPGQEYSLAVAKTGHKLQHLDENYDNSGGAYRVGRLVADHMTMSDLARSLQGFLKTPVVDTTGLTGYFKFILTWTPEDLRGRGATRVNGESIDPDGPSIFTALQEQLGLKLESAKGPVEVLVIDSVQKPSEN